MSIIYIFRGQLQVKIKGTVIRPTNSCIFADVATNSIAVMVNEGEWNSKQRLLLWAPFKDDICMA